MTTTTHRYMIGELVQPPDGSLAAVVIGYENAIGDLAARGYSGPTDVPLYLVNVGNVYDEAYEAVYAEADLTLIGWRNQTVNTAAGYPHFHEDIEAFTACQVCIDHAAESRVASGT